MSSIVGVSHKQVDEENGLLMLKVVVTFLHALIDFFMVEGDDPHRTVESNGRSTTFAAAERVIHKTARRSKKRKKKTRGVTRRRKCKKRRHRGHNRKTAIPTRMSDLSKILLMLYHHISSWVYFKQTKREQDILVCKPHVNNELVSNEESTTDFVAIFRGKTVSRNKKLPEQNPPFKDNCPSDSGIASHASTSASNTKKDTAVQPSVDAITSGDRHRVNKDDKKFVFSSAQGTQCIPADSEQVTLPSLINQDTFKEKQTYIPPQPVKEDTLISQPVKLFVSLQGGDCPPWDGLPPFKSVGEAKEHQDNYPLSCEFQLDDNPPLHGHCVDQQSVLNHQHGEKSEMVMAPLSIPPEHHPPLQEIPTEQAPVPDIQYEHEDFSNSDEQLDAIGETPIKVFPWHPPGF